MTQEEHFFIQTLSDHINKRETSKPSASLNWHTLSHLARIHQVDGIVYHQCKEFIPAEYKASFERGYSAALYTYANRVKEVQNIRSAFQKAGITYYTIKGLDVAQFYPIPSLRTMGDSDFIVSDMPSAIRIMHSLGYEGNDTAINHQWSCERNGLHFELHDMLVRKDDWVSKKQLRFFRDFMPRVTNNVLDWNYHYLFLIMHLRKHFLFSGVGIRQFMDIAVITRYGPKLNWIWIENRLAELDLATFAHICYALIETWFGIKAPVKYEKTEITDEISEKILKNGIFGFADENNRLNWTRNQLLLNQRPRWANQIALILSAFFPDYGTMVFYPGCAFLKNRKYLLPLAWVRRFAHLIMRRDFSKAGKVLKSRTIDKGLDKYAARIRKMGL